MRGGNVRQYLVVGFKVHSLLLSVKIWPWSIRDFRWKPGGKRGTYEAFRPMGLILNEPT